MRLGFKRVISGLLAGIIIASSTTICTFAKDFEDVESDKWYSNSVSWVSDYGLMNGTSANRFSPNEGLTRAMFAQILYNMAGNPNVDGQNDLVDVNHAKWYNKAIDWALENKVMSGYGNNRFGPDDTITREQVATVLNNYTDCLPIPRARSLSEFKDSNKISSWAMSSMLWAVENKIISGIGDERLDPRGTASRAQIATIIENYCKNVATEIEWPTGKDFFEDEIKPKPDDSDDSYYLNPDLVKIHKTDNGCCIVKYLGDTSAPEITNNSVVLYIRKGNTAQNMYRVYSGKEYRFEFPYGAGEYTLSIGLLINRQYHHVYSETVEVTEEEYQRSLLESTTFCDYRTSSQVQSNARYAATTNIYLDKVPSNDYEKALSIYLYMCNMYEYDNGRLEEVDWGYTPDFDRIIEKNGAICLDFAGMYSAMCRSEGIKSRIIVGWVNKGTSLEGYHAWSEVLIDGEWIQVDPTLGINNSAGIREYVDLLSRRGFDIKGDLAKKYTYDYTI